jgi:hypothetical protein
MASLPGMDFDSIGNIRQAVRSGDICQWFSDDLAVKYAGALPARFENAKTIIEKEEIYRETSVVLAIYAICTYYIYQNSKDFRKKVDLSKEHSRNFKRIGAWLEKNEGKKMADEFFENIMRMKIESAED